MTKLTDKQQRFIEEYLVDLNATQAAIRAGYSPKTAKSFASQLLTRPHITRAIAEAQAARSKRTHITQDRVLEELAHLALGRITDVVEWADERVALIDSEALSIRAKAALSEVVIRHNRIDKGKDEPDIEVVETKVKMHQKTSALSLLMDHLGMKKAPEQPFGYDLSKLTDSEYEDFKRRIGQGESAVDAYIHALTASR